jgi:hypothetical protein
MAVATQRVDVGAMAATVRGEAAERVASMIATTAKALEEAGNGLNEKQAAEFIEGAVYSFDGFERSCAKAIVEALSTVGVEVWGLPDNLEDLYVSKVPA